MTAATATQLIDKLLESIGIWGKYQFLQLAVLVLIAWPASNQLYSTIYIGYAPPLRCHEPNNHTLWGNHSATRPFYDTCKKLFEETNVTSCSNGYDYDNPKAASFVTEWDLVCDQSYRAQLAQTALVIGQAVGATFFTYLGDRFGRYKACILSQWLMLAVSTGAIFAPSIPIYTFIKFLIGVAQQGIVMAFQVIPLELMPTTNRTLSHMFSSLVWPIFLCVEVLMAYLMREVSWRYFQGALTAVSVLALIPTTIFLDETIRWLVANERKNRLEKIIGKATKLNNADPGEVKDKFNDCVRANQKTCQDAKEDSRTTEKDEEKNAKQHKGSLLDILKNRRLRITTLIMFFAWIVNSLTSFGIALTVSKLSGNRFLNYFLINVVYFPAAFVSYFALVKFGRKRTCMIFHALAGLFLITSVLLDTFLGESASTAVSAFTILGRLSITGSWASLFQYTPELYPTNLRSLGLGMSSSVSRIGGALAPFSNLVIDYIPWLPSTVYGCSCLVVCFLVFYLPETLNRELPQTLDEIKEWSNNNNGVANDTKKKETYTNKAYEMTG